MKEIVFGCISGVIAATGMGGRYDLNFAFKFIWRIGTTYDTGN